MVGGSNLQNLPDKRYLSWSKCLLTVRICQVGKRPGWHLSRSANVTIEKCHRRTANVTVCKWLTDEWSANVMVSKRSFAPSASIYMPTSTLVNCVLQYLQNLQLDLDLQYWRSYLSKFPFIEKGIRYPQNNWWRSYTPKNSFIDLRIRYYVHVFFLIRTFVIRTPGSNFRFLLNRVKNITK